jgi:hypothetical protein
MKAFPWLFAAIAGCSLLFGGITASSASFDPNEERCRGTVAFVAMGADTSPQDDGSILATN